MNELLGPVTVNLKTALPLLLLLLAQRDEEPPSIECGVAWDVFKLFAALPADAEADVISFQATWVPEDIEEAPDPPMFFCTWSRELAGRGDERGTAKVILVQWKFDPEPADVGEVEMWSDSFPSVEEFFKAVESTPEFGSVMRNAAIVEIYATLVHG